VTSTRCTCAIVRSRVPRSIAIARGADIVAITD
jgi:hypothetical protein